MRARGADIGITLVDASGPVCSRYDVDIVVDRSRVGRLIRLNPPESTDRTESCIGSQDVGRLLFEFGLQVCLSGERNDRIGLVGRLSDDALDVGVGRDGGGGD